MRISESWNIGETGGTAVAIGFFDGVHRGHRAVIGAAVEEAEKRGLRPAVFSFSTAEDALPVKGGAKLLQSGEQKRRALAALGVDVLIEPDFAAIRDFDPERYAVEILFRALGAGRLLRIRLPVWKGRVGGRAGAFALFKAVRRGGS